MYDMIIIGAGPGGVGAAIYAKRAGMNVLVIDQNSMTGGQVLTTYEVDNYLGFPGVNGFDLGMKFKEHADYLGISILAESVSTIDMEGDVKRVVTDKDTYESKTIILAMGASHKTLGVEGEKRLTGSGVSYCATCDGAFFKGTNVAVVGGGDVAAEDALYLSRFCEKVYLLHRRDTLRAAKSLQDKLEASEKVEILWNTEIEEIRGQWSVSDLLIKNNISGETTTLPVSGVFVAVGINPNNELVKNKILCDDAGYIKAGEDCLTSIPGVAVVGDLRSKELRQIITAVADGANAVTSLERYIL